MEIKEYGINELIKDYKSCIKSLKLLKRIYKDKKYKGIFNKKEMEELINYYKEKMRR